jgi:hypothetical protein
MISNIFIRILKNALAYHDASDVAVIAVMVGLAPDLLTFVFF